MKTPTIDQVVALVRNGFRATDTHVGDGVVDFDRDGVRGLAYGKESTVRASFILDADSDTDEAESWVRDHRKVDGVDLHVAYDRQDDSRGILRVLVELPAHDLRGAAVAADEAGALAVAWEHRGAHDDGARDLVTSLSSAGRVVPPLGLVAGRVQRFGPWSWGTRYTSPMGSYLFDVDAAARLVSSSDGPVFALSHAGHGANSWALTALVPLGAVQVLVQHPYGGAYSDSVGDLDAINATYARMHVLSRTTTHSERPQWLLVHSALRGVTGLLDLSAGEAGDCRP